MPLRRLLFFLGAALLVYRAAGEPLDLRDYRLVDLTHAYNADTVFWPTTPPERFKLERTHYGETDVGYFYSANTFCLPEHGGTRFTNTGTVLTAALVTPGDPIPTGPTRIGTLQLVGADGSGQLDMVETVDASLDLGAGTARELFFVPEPRVDLLAVVGVAGLAALSRLRRRR